MITKKQLEPKQSKTGITILALISIIIIVLVLVLYVPSLLQPKIIEIGDCAEIEYIGRFTENGTVFTTTYHDPVTKTGGLPQNLFINPNKNLARPSECGATYIVSSIPPEALRALVGMKEGETKTINLSSAEAFGDWDTSLADSYGFRTYPINEIWNTVVENVSLDDFLYYFPDVEVQTGIIFDYWGIAFNISGILNAQITKIANEAVSFKILPINGTTFTLPPFNLTTVILVTNNTAFTVHSDIQLNHTFSFQDAESKEIILGKVIAVNETEATIGLNSRAPKIDFIGQNLTFEFKVVKITKTTR